MKNSAKTIITVACIASVTIIGAAGAFGYFSGKQTAKEREIETRVLVDENDPDSQGKVQWKYSDESDSCWREISTVYVLDEGDTIIKKDENASEVEFRNNNFKIQYKNRDGEWTDLVAMSTFEGTIQKGE